MPDSVASTDAGDVKEGLATPGTTRCSTPTIPTSANDLPLSLSTISIKNTSPSHSNVNAEELLLQRRRDFYPTAWKKLMEKNNFDGTITTIQRYLDITKPEDVDLDAYFTLIAAASKRNKDAEMLDKIDMYSARSDADLVDIHLLRGIVRMRNADIERAKEEVNIALEKAYALGSPNDAHWVMALVACYTEDYVEAMFHKSVVPEDYAMTEKFRVLLGRMHFNGAKWYLRSIPYDRKLGYTPVVDLTKELPMPANFKI